MPFEQMSLRLRATEVFSLTQITGSSPRLATGHPPVVEGGKKLCIPEGVCGQALGHMRGLLERAADTGSSKRGCCPAQQPLLLGLPEHLRALCIEGAQLECFKKTAHQGA